MPDEMASESTRNRRCTVIRPARLACWMTDAFVVTIPSAPTRFARRYASETATFPGLTWGPRATLGSVHPGGAVFDAAGFDVPRRDAQRDRAVVDPPRRADRGVGLVGEAAPAVGMGGEDQHG